MHGRDLQNVVERIRRNLDSGHFRNESSVREAIVNPILQNLGWDVIDPTIVIREHKLAERRVDYALAIPPQGPIVIIEVKGLGLIVGGDRQLFEYAFHRGVPFAILTDGREWHFFLPGEQGDYSERRVYKLDLLERTEAECVRAFQRYLEFDRVRGGQALEDARKDYRDAARQREIAKILPRAWMDILEERDETLLELLAAKAETLCGFRPEAEQVESFIAEILAPSARSPRGFVGSGGDAVGALPRRENAPKGGNDVHPASTKPEKPPVSGAAREISYELLGKPYRSKNAKAALLEILKKLSNDDPKFYEELSPLVSKRKRNHIASSQELVYPDNPALLRSVVQLVPGWWIGLNIANREKQSILQRACEVAKLRYGADLKIELPNA